MLVRFTRRGEQSVERIDDRWRQNRPASPDLFWSELKAVLVLLAANPELGVHYKTRAGDVVRRVLLRRSEQHVYYAISDNELAILVIWGARRERPPKL